ncbi:MAG TPA: phospholipase D-like domain-containing protein [Planctomycetota bacterium]|nr:phospholipase D-like domain-containing protein [Planctomycetota bacterium]
MNAPEREPGGRLRAGPDGAGQNAQAGGAGLLPGERLRASSARLLIDGCEALPAMLGAIRGAAASVDLETYILRDDATGREFAAALADAARRSVRVRLLFDGVGSLGLPDAFVAGLTAAGVSTAVFHPLRFLRRPLWLMNRRDHRKILVVDGRRSFTGGLNLADDYACRVGAWRDTHVELEGAAVARAFTAAFEYAWARADLLGPRPAVAPPPEDGPDGPGAPGGVPLQIITNQMFGQRRRIRNAYRRAIQRARRCVLVENAYFLPDPSILKALVQAARRGVRVNLVLAARSDVRLAQLAGRATYPRLLRSGVRIFEWSQSVLHAKTMTVDDLWSFVGSYNLDHRSLMLNLEAVVLLEDPDFARRLRAQTETDIARCREVTLADCRARPWLERAMQQLAYRLRSWL